MANWISIGAADLKASGLGFVVDKAQTSSTGGSDPVAEEIANAVARVRRAVASGNPLDSDPAKVPASLRGVAVRMALYALMERIRVPLSDDQRETRKSDHSDLLRIADRRVLVEAPDSPMETSTVPMNVGCWNSENKIIPRTHPLPRPGQQRPAASGKYANPEGPEDEA
jgi:hypothetical protein